MGRLRRIDALFLPIRPNAAFRVDWTANMILIVVIGGLGRIEGPVLGTILVFALQDSLAGYGRLFMIILGIVPITTTFLATQGLWGLVTKHRPTALVGLQRRPVPDPTGPASDDRAGDG